MNILIADDHALFRESLKMYVKTIDSDIHVRDVATYAEVLCAMKEGTLYDLVILDMMMPGMYDLEGVRHFRERYADIPVALMSGIAEDHHARLAIQIGACGYMPKTLSGQAMMDAMRLMLNGGVYVPYTNENQIKPSYHSDSIHRPRQQKTPELLPVENNVLQFLKTGENNKTIARNLDISLSTVKLHMRNLCKKFDVQNRTQVALKAKQLGMI